MTAYMTETGCGKHGFCQLPAGHAGDCLDALQVQKAALGLVAVGAKRWHSPGSQLRKCEICKGQAWFTKGTTANALRAAKGLPISWICEGCMYRVTPEPDAEVVAYSAEQIAELHASGIDASAEQLQEQVQQLGRAILRKGKR